jgi:very-short-patch-repair endonuclease
VGGAVSTELSRKLRRSASPPERAMWRILHPFRQAGFHFRRQVQIGSYYVDCACLEPSIAIEVDGDTHGGDLARSNDEMRDDYLSGRGFRVLRFWNNDVMTNPDGVYQAVAAVLEPVSPPTPDPSPRGGGRHHSQRLAP